MDENQEEKHMCKFCYKIYPSGRSLGGHMRSHFINIPSSNHQKADHNLPNKKPNRTRKFSKRIEEDTLLEDIKLCKECGKSFQSWKALFGHMKCHSAIGKATSSSCNYSSDSQKLIMDNQSDNETATPLCRQKRSDRTKRYATSTTTNSTSLTVLSNSSPCISKIDQQEQEEVALSLILLSKDAMNSVFEYSFCTSSQLIESKKTAKTSITESKQSDQFRNPDDVSRKRLKTSKSRDSPHAEEDKVKNKNLEIGCYDSEVNSPKCIDPNDFEAKSKFRCVICKKDFNSYQALGGHRASHKKFNGCCAPTIENENSPNQSDKSKLIECDSSKNLIGVFSEKIDTRDHECPICFKVFQSGQALGGHRRSHLLIGDQGKSSDQSNYSVQKSVPEIRVFLDLNLPAPVDEEEERNDELKKLWWTRKPGHQPENGPLLGLISS